MIHRFDCKGLKVRDRTEGEWFSNFSRVLATWCGVCLSVYNSLTNQKAQSMNDPRRSFRSWNELLLVSNFRSRSIGPCTLKQCSEDNVSYWRIFCHGRNFRKRLIKISIRKVILKICSNYFGQTCSDNCSVQWTWRNLSLS